jgi:hypothetical protein
MDYINRANKEQDAMEKENTPVESSAISTPGPSQPVVEESIVFEYKGSSDDEEDKQKGS